MSDEHYAVCPECVRVVEKPSQSHAESVVGSHNDSRHDSDDVARVLDGSTDDVNEFMDYAREQVDGPTYRELVEEVLDKNPGDTLNV